MKIAYVTAGAAGMYCGSCMKDNTLVAALVRQGCDALLVPTYTPIRTDEENVSQRRIFFGGINVYLQQKLGLFRHTPWFLDRLLDIPTLLRWVSRFAVKTEAESLGDLTISMLRGHDGYQSKEVDKLVGWLADEIKPELINLTNALLSGMVPDLKRRLGVPVLCTLQGDDVFLESLPQPQRGQALDLVRAHCRQIDGFIATSGDYADFMADYFAIPRQRIHVVYPGLNLAGHGGPRPDRTGQPFTIGYFARIAPEKGLHVLVEAFCLLRQVPGLPPSRLRVAGWLGEHNRLYLEDLHKRIQNAGLGEHFEQVEAPDHASKVQFLQGIDVLSVPATFREPKGLYVLEALANGVPVVQPRHGSFPELVEATGGGLLVNPNEPHDLARGLRQLLEEPGRAEMLGQRGKEVVHQRFHADRMARETLAIYERYLIARTEGLSMAEVFRTTRRIEFADTDMAGIVHFAQFFRFMEAAEQEFLRARGLSVVLDWDGRHMSFPRVAACCDFSRPVRFEDVIDIEVALDRVGAKSITYRFTFRKEGEELATGQLSCVCCLLDRDRNRLESVAIPAGIRARLLG